MNAEEIKEVAGGVIDRLGGHCESILYYPHPFGENGLVVVFRDDVEAVVGHVAEARLRVPLEVPLYCLRHRELFELSLPVYSWLRMVNRHVYMVYWLKHEGVVLFGRDIRGQLELPRAPRLMLACHVGVSTHYLRSGVILDSLQRKDYLGLIGTLERQVRMLMATALLLHGEWRVTAETVAERFGRFFPDGLLEEAWRGFGRLLARPPDEDEEAQCRAAFEAAWLFERFVRRLRRYAG